MSGSLIRGPAGEPRHFCIELFDLTERRRVAQARRERAVAQAADRAKSELLALVSHDVRTPLHAVIGFAQVLRSMQLPPERQLAAIDHILGAGRHLLQLMNDLLDLTGAETGQLQLVLEPVQAQEVVAEAMEIVAGLADERSITLRSRPAAGAFAVRADRHRLRQVLLNLLGNAIKFTPAGGAVEVVIGSAEILVQDTGDGIPPDQLPFLFTPFHRGVRRQRIRSRGIRPGVGAVAAADAGDGGRPHPAHLVKRGHHVSPDPAHGVTGRDQPGAPVAGVDAVTSRSTRRNSATSIGFVMHTSAPAARARARSCELVTPVSATTGNPSNSGRLRTCSMSRKPPCRSAPIIRSVTRTLGVSSISRSRAAPAIALVRTACPSASRTIRSSSRPA